MIDIIIVTAGSSGHEVYTLITEINEFEEKSGRRRKYNILGFIDDTIDELPDNDWTGSKILGKIMNWHPISNEVYAMGIVNPKSKEKLATMLKSRGCRFETLIAPYGLVRPHVQIGEGSIIRAYSINNGARIGRFVTVSGSMIGGEAVIGDYSTTTGFANIADGKLGTRVFVGSQSVVLDVEVGDDAFVCAGSVVMRKVKSGIKVIGNPASQARL